MSYCGVSLILLLSLLLGLTAPAPAQEVGSADPLVQASEAAATLGPRIGELAPDFVAPDTQGALQSRNTLGGEAGLVIYFNRSLDWCPICLRQVLEINTRVDAFESRGYGLAVLTHDTPETLSRVARQRDLSMTLLADPESVVIDAFGLRDPVYADPDHFAHGVPYPIAIVIAPDGTVLTKFWHEAGLGEETGYRVRVSIDDVLAGLDALQP